MNENSIKPKSSKSGMWIIIALIALFAMPEIVGVGLKVMNWRPKSSTNRGELVQPARPIVDADFRTIDEKAVKFSDFKSKWVMIHFSDSKCTEICIKNLYYMRQVMLALGKEKGRIQRVFVVTDTTVTDALKSKLKDLPDMTTIIGPKKTVAELERQFTLSSATGVDTGRIYLVDPLGNLMMTYRDDPSGMLKDLTHLMKISWSG